VGPDVRPTVVLIRTIWRTPIRELTGTARRALAETRRTVHNRGESNREVARWINLLSAPIRRARAPSRQEASSASTAAITARRRRTSPSCGADVITPIAVDEETYPVLRRGPRASARLLRLAGRSIYREQEQTAKESGQLAIARAALKHRAQQPASGAASPYTLFTRVDRRLPPPSGPAT
jgi:hypothetical protein